MGRENIIINDVLRQIKDYESIYEYEIENSYKEIYLSNSSDESKKSLLYVFSFLHNRLNDLLELFNNKIKGGLYYNANSSRDLIKLIDTITNLINNLKNTEYGFRLVRSYFFYLIKLKGILKESNGTRIPEDTKQLFLIKYEKIFNFISDNNDLVNIDILTDNCISKVSTRNASFTQMEDDEKLGCINMAIEGLLKKTINMFQ